MIHRDSEARSAEWIKGTYMYSTNLIVVCFGFHLMSLTGNVNDIKYFDRQSLRAFIPAMVYELISLSGFTPGLESVKLRLEIGTSAFIFIYQDSMNYLLRSLRKIWIIILLFIHPAKIEVPKYFYRWGSYWNPEAEDQKF